MLELPHHEKEWPNKQSHLSLVLTVNSIHIGILTGQIKDDNRRMIDIFYKQDLKGGKKLGKISSSVCKDGRNLVGIVLYRHITELKE